MTQQKSSRKTCRISTLFAADFLVKVFQSLENGEDSTMCEEPCSLKLLGSLPLKDLMQKLSEMYPDIKFEHEWADEDIGNNCGRYVYYDGKRIEEYFPESQKDCLEFAARVMDARLEEDYSLYLNATETEYINIEYDDEYELIEVAGHTALFTNDRITDANIPKGMYCYHLRHNDGGEFFAKVRKDYINNKADRP